MNNSIVDIQPEIIPSLLVLNETIPHSKGGFSSPEGDPILLYAYALYTLFATKEYLSPIHTALQQLHNHLQTTPSDTHVYTPELAYTLALLDEDNLIPDTTPVYWENWDSHLYEKGLSTLQQNGHGPGKQTIIWKTIQYFTKRSTAHTPHSYLPHLLRESLPYMASHYIQMSHTSASHPQPERIHLGLNGGLAGMLLVLLQAYEVCPLPELKTTIQQGISYVLSFRQDIDFSEGNYSAFPDTTNGRYAGSQFSHTLTWQSGDLLQAWVFYRAADLFKDKELEKLANLIGLNTVLRITPETTSVTDATLGKGSAGLSLLYHLLYLSTQHTIYQNTSLFWMEQTLQGLQGSKEPVSATSIMQGKAGIGLALIAVASDKVPNWVSILLG